MSHERQVFLLIEYLFQLFLWGVTISVTQLCAHLRSHIVAPRGPSEFHEGWIRGPFGVVIICCLGLSVHSIGAESLLANNGQALNDCRVDLSLGRFFVRVEQMKYGSQASFNETHGYYGFTRHLPYEHGVRKVSSFQLHKRRGLASEWST